VCAPDRTFSRQVLGDYIVLSRFEVVLVNLFKESDVDVGRRHMAVSSHLTAEPSCDRASSSAHLEAAPPLAYTQSKQPPLGHRIQMLFEQFEPAVGSFPSIVESVLGHLESAPTVYLSDAITT
jgi:hypothetical protein